MQNGTNVTKADPALEVDWTLTAASYLDQLPAPEKSRVLHAIEQLAAGWSSLDTHRLSRVGQDKDGLFALRAGAELRVIVRRMDSKVVVVDVVRNSQVDALRRVAMEQPAASA